MYVLCYLCRTIALVATVICWLYPTLNKFHLILSFILSYYRYSDFSCERNWVRFGLISTHCSLTLFARVCLIGEWLVHFWWAYFTCLTGLGPFRIYFSVISGDFVFTFYLITIIIDHHVDLGMVMMIVVVIIMLDMVACRQLGVQPTQSCNFFMINFCYIGGFVWPLNPVFDSGRLTCMPYVITMIADGVAPNSASSGQVIKNKQETYIYYYKLLYTHSRNIM